MLPEEIQKRGFKKVLVVTDKSLYEVGVSKKVTDLLDKAKIEYKVFHEVLPNPPIENVNEGLAMCKEINADLIVAVGGGSSIDTAKAISIVMTNPDKGDIVFLLFVIYPSIACVKASIPVEDAIDFGIEAISSVSTIATIGISCSSTQTIFISLAGSVIT